MLKIKRIHEDAVLPYKSNPDDSGYDVVAVDCGVWNEDHTYIEYRTGIVCELPQGYEMQIRARSSISKYDLMLCNGIGTIDNGYRGEIKLRFKPIVRFKNGSPLPTLIYSKGDKIGQLVLAKVENLEILEVEHISDSQRGSGCFGSTGK